MHLATLMQPVPLNACVCDRTHHIWGASMVRDDEGLCHLFYSRWPRSTGFNSWVVCSEIAHAVAPDPCGPYRHQGIALPDRGVDFWDGLCTHNPTVHRFDGTYYLYYMGNTGDGRSIADQTDLNWHHRNNQRIGVAIADTPDGPWTRFEKPLIDVKRSPASTPDALAVANPSVVRRPGGDYLMIYKVVEQTHPLPFGGPVTHRAALSRRPEGPFEPLPSRLFHCDGVAFPFEDPFVWYQQGRFYAILKDMGCHTQATARALVLFESGDGLNWSLAEESLVSDRTIRFEDGSVKTFDYLERPQIYFENGSPRVLFCAARDGDNTCNLHVPLERP